MKKNLLISAFFLLVPLCAYTQEQEVEPEVDKAVVVDNVKAAATAQDALQKAEAPANNWKCTGIVGFDMSVTGLWNWAAGGNNNANGHLFANVSLLYKKDRFAWDSNLDTDFGLSFIDQTKFPWQKTSDKINFSTKFGYEFAKSWYVTALGSFKSQYAKGYSYKNDEKTYISHFLSPSYTDLSVGIDWKPNSIFSVYLSPVAGRITSCTVPELRENYGVANDKTNRAEFGLTFKGNVLYDKIENFKVLSALSLFTPYSKKFGNFDVDWDVAVSYKFLKVLNVTLSTSLKYYDSVLIAGKDGHKCPRVQFKSVLGLGVGYSF
ncbi:MAG: DUF3078 domain-containing protein [Paludibacteraceae bacterium]|jgi:hypothetical protein|nr:DUF3078 domain-containing protein [Paludibacteraceae bacterium]HHT61880.1 DUF3078 domain-containing protein [Bacteroidales bacterium]MBP9039117.1 DUF3078 domain-containing protein [Paludibacteraceae bacterium]HOG36268.1 DUF3078 domain-containing protein [Paludibacteraceae bacterium]HOS37026.1 DUF3078 domain-containing protein [Paludibacteraceae bacterium]